MIGGNMSRNKLTAYLCSTFICALIIIIMSSIKDEKAIEIVDGIDVAGYWGTILAITFKKEEK